jgi:formate dehydrogenase iron-sulfur subunit
MTELAVHRPDAQRMGFFTDTTVCIGCKACACDVRAGRRA